MAHLFPPPSGGTLVNSGSLFNVWFGYIEERLRAEAIPYVAIDVRLVTTTERIEANPDSLGRVVSERTATKRLRK